MLILSDANRIPSFTGLEAIHDMQVLFGGEVRRRLGWLGAHYSLRSPDKQFYAHVNGSRKHYTSVQIATLEAPENAVRLTTLWAYEAKHGRPFGELIMQTPGVRGYTLWAIPNGRSDQVKPFTSGPRLRADTAYLDTLDYHLAELNRAVEKVDVAKYRDDNAITEAESARIKALDRVQGLLLDSVCTGLYAHGYTLPVAARRMAAGFNDLAPTDNPGLLVTKALGVQGFNLEQFDNLWAEAMDQTTPLAAGQFILRHTSG